MQERYLTNARLDKYKTNLDLSTDEFLGHKTSKSKPVLDLQKLSVFYNVDDKRSRDRYKVELRFKGLLYFGWPNQPSSGRMKIYIGTHVYIADKYLRNSGTT